MNFLRDVIDQAIDFRLYNIHTHLPAKILSYDPAKKKASVQPTIKKMLADGNSVSMPVISNVPVIFPFGGDVGLSVPVKVGDYCLLLFSERSLDRWLTFGGEVENPDPRAFDITDAIAIPGLMPFSDDSGISNNNDVVLKNKTGTITIQENGTVIINANGTIIKADSSGKIAIGKGSVELLQQIYNVFQKLGLEAAGAGMVQTAAAANAAATAINTIKGTL